MKMRILWFSVVAPKKYSTNDGYHGGGWISSLQKLIAQEDVELGVAFEGNSEKSIDSNGIYYFPINAYDTLNKRIRKTLDYKKEELFLVPKCLEVIKEFKPDIIHIFGSESAFGLISQHTSIPTVIHMQGSLPSYYNARFPPGMSMTNLLLSSKLTIKQKFWALKFDAVMKGRAKREARILKQCSNYMGRTHWDKAIVSFYNPTCKYYHVEEALRDSFTNINTYWQYNKREKLILSSTISGPWYKGLDLILKSAKLLKENTNIDFEWRVFGVQDIKFFEQHYSINSSFVNVNICGIVNETVLKERLLDSDFYIHPSYIDNSPNSLCEAQILGVPVICTNVGGVSTIVEDNITGFLVPANDPLHLSYLVSTYYNNEKKLKEISANQIECAKKRHDKTNIIKQIMSTYQSILDDKKINSGVS